VAQGKEMGEDRSLRFAMELFCSAANQESSKQEYRGVLRSLGRHLDQAGISRCSELSWPQLFSYQASLAPLAPTTRHHRLLLIRQFLRFLEGCGWAEPGLERAIRLPPLPPHHPRPALGLPDQLRLIRAAPNSRMRLLVLLLLATGARPGELLACDLASLQDGQLQLRGKTGERWVPLPPTLGQELAGEIQSRRERLGEAPPSPLFRSRQGRLSRRRLRELLDDCCQRAGMPRVSPHQLRHAACARWLRAGVPLLLVSQALGHYASLISQDLEQGLSLDPLEAALSQPPAAARTTVGILGR
jgi:integrase/recombinase XerC